MSACVYDYLKSSKAMCSRWITANVNNEDFSIFLNFCRQKDGSYGNSNNDIVYSFCNSCTNIS